MSSFGSMDIGRTGVGFASNWIDSIAHNLANTSTVVAGGQEPFRAIKPVATELRGGPFAPTGSGVAVGAQLRQGGQPGIQHDPTNPLADAEGNVTLPVVEMGSEMVDLMIAQRHYQVNMRTVQSAREAYQTALRLGGN